MYIELIPVTTNNIEHVIVGLDDEVAMCGGDLSTQRANPLRIVNLIKARFKVPITRIQLHHLNGKYPEKPECIWNIAARLPDCAEVTIYTAVQHESADPIFESDIVEVYTIAPIKSP